MNIRTSRIGQLVWEFGYLRTWVVVVLFILGCVVVVVGTAVGWVALDRRSCAESAAAMGTTYSHNVWTGCLVADDDGRMVPLDNYRVVRQP